MSDGKVTGLSNVWGNIVRSVTGKLPDLKGAAKDTVDALEQLVTDSGAASLASRGAERLGGYLHEGAELVHRAVDAASETGEQLASDALDGLEAGLNKALPVTINDMAVIGRNVMHIVQDGHLSPEQRFILSKLSPDAAFSLAKLSVEDVGKFLKVGSAVMFWDGAKRLKAESGLLLLLVRGDLTREPPGGGKRLLDVLAERAFKPVDPRLAERGMQVGEALSDVIEEAAMPMIVRQGKGSSTCVAGSLQAAKAAEDPAGYAELVLGLVQDGHATVTGADGSARTVFLDTHDIDDGHKGQDLLDAAIQGSMVTFAKTSIREEGGAEDFGGGRVGGGGRFGGGRLGSGTRFGGGRLGSGGHFGGGRVGGGGRYGGGRVGSGGRLGGEVDAGLTLPQADFLYEATLGRRGRAVNVDDENAAQVLARIEEVAGEKPVQVGLQAVQADGSIGGHMLAVQGTATDREGEPLIIVSDSTDGEVTAIPRDQFQQMLIGAILPD